MATTSPRFSVGPLPNGWYAIALSNELRPGGEKIGCLAGVEYRLKRSNDGRLTFNEKAELVAELNGFIFAWSHRADVPPTWHLPLLDETGWLPFRHRLLRARAHPQEIYENSFDFAHFFPVHGFVDAASLEEPSFDRHTAKVRYEIERASLIPWIGGRTKSNFEVKLHGLGCAHNHINVPAFRMSVRMLALATPTEPGHLEIRLAVSIFDNLRIPKIVLPFIHRLITRTIVHDFSQDIEIWENKRFLPSPLLIRGDGPIMGFRRWGRQFY